MAEGHEKAYLICENKCFVEGEPKKRKIEFNEDGTFSTGIDAGISGHYEYWVTLDAIQENETDFYYEYGLGLSDSKKGVNKCVEMEVEIFDMVTSGFGDYHKRLEPTDNVKNLLATKKYVIAGNDLSMRSYFWEIPLWIDVLGQRIELSHISRQAMIKINVYAE